MSPTQRTLKALKEMGRKCGIVEKFNYHAGPHGIRQDLFGIIDIIALDPVKGVVGVQSCGQAFSEHLKKLCFERHASTVRWISTPGATLELWGWRKVKVKRGGKQKVWKPRILEVTMDVVTQQMLK